MGKQKKHQQKKFQSNLKGYETKAIDRNFMNAPVNNNKHNLKAFSLSRVKK